MHERTYVTDWRGLLAALPWLCLTPLWYVWMPRKVPLPCACYPSAHFVSAKCQLSLWRPVRSQQAAIPGQLPPCGQSGSAVSFGVHATLYHWFPLSSVLTRDPSQAAAWATPVTKTATSALEVGSATCFVGCRAFVGLKPKH